MLLLGGTGWGGGRGRGVGGEARQVRWGDSLVRGVELLHHGGESLMGNPRQFQAPFPPSCPVCVRRVSVCLVLVVPGYVSN